MCRQTFPLSIVRMLEMEFMLSSVHHYSSYVRVGHYFLKYWSETSLFVCLKLVLISAGQITGFVCQDALVFNLETGFCDQKGYVASCGGARLISSPSTLSISSKGSAKTSFITTQPSYHSSGKWDIICWEGVKFVSWCSNSIGFSTLCSAEEILY